ncbi:hypothetical protein BW730_03200 [Tessaracoccus aquimaris]|uniref:Sec-independent protein translocase protein TatA n=1 Tax=Tessaracoccus aquimaris TaxID=1332264 RepID=A0A1Q2CKQ0_9ACTN|nr:twin-arginine translocase TatA/TatE family subunit [Tessaracoccus aquimaris]AQP46681.1 hypothetical protein BW730_03200 [Tessaracoccus aquimaris]
MPLGGWELAIVLVVALLLFGGSRLAGVGKGVGRSIREFKDEVKGPEGPAKEEIVEAEIVQPEIDRNKTES